MRNVACRLSAEETTKTTCKLHIIFFSVPSKHLSFIVARTNNFTARIFRSVRTRREGLVYIEGTQKLEYWNKNFCFLICFLCRILWFLFNAYAGLTRSGQSRGEFQLCFNVNVYFNITLNSLFSLLVFLFYSSIQSLICADKKYRIQIGIDRPSIVIANFMLVIIIVSILAIRRNLAFYPTCKSEAWERLVCSVSAIGLILSFSVRINNVVECTTKYTENYHSNQGFFLTHGPEK